MKFLHSFLKELKLAKFSFYFLIEIVMAIVMVLVLMFLVPEKTIVKEEAFVFLDEYTENLFIDELNEAEMKKTTFKIDDEKIELDTYESEREVVYLVLNKENIEVLVTDYNIKALALTYDGEKVNSTYYLEGYTDEKSEQFLKLVSSVDSTLLEEEIENIEIVTIGKGINSLNNKEQVLPIMLVVNGSLMGFFIIASYIFIDKEEGIIKAYSVTPSKTFYYLLSKVLVVVLASIITSLIVVFPIMLFNVNYLMLLFYIIATSFFASALGVLITTFYKSINQAFSSIFLIMIILMIPMFSYFIYSWHPLIIDFFPSYYMIEYFKDIFLKTNYLMVLLVGVLFLISGFIILFLSDLKFKKNLGDN